VKKKSQAHEEINVTGEKNKKFFKKQKFNDHKFPKRKRLIAYKSPIIHDYVMVEQEDGHRHITTNQTSHKKGNKQS
jgi:hypothetical protein